MKKKKANEDAGNPPNELSVSGDETWAKRGFSSMIGVLVLIGKHNNKIVDLLVKSSACKACEMAKAKYNIVEFEMWSNEHKNECTANHEGSSGKMELHGILELFERSEKLHKVKYANYIGDGASKTFSALQNAKPYGNFTINKLECVLHVGKRMYKCLQEVKKKLIILEKEKRKNEQKK